MDQRDLSRSTRVPKLVVLMLVIIPAFTGCMRERYNYHSIRAKAEIKAASSPLRTQQLEIQREISSGPVSLQKAVRVALLNNPDIDTAIARIRQSDAMIDEANAAFLPVLAFYGEYMQGDAPSAYLFKKIDQRKLPKNVDFNDPGWFSNYEIGLRASLNIFNGGRDLIRKKMAETGLQIQELDRRTVENALVTSVIHSYYNILVAQDYIQISRASVKTVDTQLRIMRAKYKAGGALKSDILSLEVRLARSREDLIGAQNNYSLSVAAISNLLGIDPDTTIQLSGPQDVFALDLPQDYQIGLVYALANRPELKKVRLQIVQSYMALDVARSEFLPRMDAFGRYYLDDPGFHFDTSRENWTAGIILNWDLFTGFSTGARIGKSKGVLDEMLAADRKTTQEIQLDVKTSYLKLAEAKARLAVAEASVAQAEEGLRLVKKQYEGGSATITRYLDAELARNLAQNRVAAARNDREKTWAAVGRAVGYWAQYAQGVATNSHEK
jgi:outer membrane protein